MTTAEYMRAATLARPADNTRAAPPAPGGAAAAWRWLVHNVRVAFFAQADGERPLSRQPAALRALIHDAAVALVTTRDSAGRLHIQPMTPIRRAFDGEIWFPASASMPVVAHVRGRADIQVTILDPGSAQRSVVLDGIARVFTDGTGAATGWRSRLSRWRRARSRVDAPAFIRVDVVSADVWE